jgi:hypothetical protein
LLGLKLKIAFSVQYSCGKKVKTLFGRKAAPHRPHGKNRPHRTACFFFHAMPTLVIVFGIFQILCIESEVCCKASTQNRRFVRFVF